MIEPARSPSPADYEKLGVFYLGRRYDRAASAVTAENYLYDSKDLTTHAVCAGMTGSGKTGLCISLLEEAALDGIPAIAIDPKGDVANLMLLFPDLAARDFEPWVDPGEARRRGQDPAAFAAAVAAQWRDGLAQWGQDGARIARLRAACDIAIYTPGSTAGLPLRLLRSFAPPPAETLSDREALAERIEGTVAGLVALLGLEADPLRSPEPILLAKILEQAWTQRPRPRPAGLDPRDPEAAVRHRRRVRSRVLPARRRAASTSRCAATTCWRRPRSPPGSTASRSRSTGC